MYVDKHEQEGIPTLFRHSEYGPHGDGIHGFMGKTGDKAVK